jgi:hypothetical protein
MLNFKSNSKHQPKQQSIVKKKYSLLEQKPLKYRPQVFELVLWQVEQLLRVEQFEKGQCLIQHV